MKMKSGRVIRQARFAQGRVHRPLLPVCHIDQPWLEVHILSPALFINLSNRAAGFDWCSAARCRDAGKNPKRAPHLLWNAECQETMTARNRPGFTRSATLDPDSAAVGALCNASGRRARAVGFHRPIALRSGHLIASAPALPMALWS